MWLVQLQFVLDCKTSGRDIWSSTFSHRKLLKSDDASEAKLWKLSSGPMLEYRTLHVNVTCHSQNPKSEKLKIISQDHPPQSYISHTALPKRKQSCNKRVWEENLVKNYSSVHTRMLSAEFRSIQHRVCSIAFETRGSMCSIRLNGHVFSPHLKLTFSALSVPLPNKLPELP